MLLEDMSRDQIRDLFREILAEADQGGPVEIAPKFKEGTLLLRPANPDQQSKEIPIETFFHKIVMVRDRLRVLEQRINAHKSLSDADRVELQQYITRVYGSLTTFNVLFRSDRDRFGD
jgi:hypothetical protein